MSDGLELDPHDVLGVNRGCSAEELRDAYRKKSKKHHPDGGGDEWAFRTVVWAHEALNQAFERDRLFAQSHIVPDTGRIRQGVQDKNVDPTRLVQVEVVWMRYEVEDVFGIIADRTGEDRNLSGSLLISWPLDDLTASASEVANSDKILVALNAAFDDLRSRTPATVARSRIADGRFRANLGYANGKTASDAFKHLHVNLKARGLGVKQWTRDVAIPRENDVRDA